MRGMVKYHYLFHLIAYYLAWFGCMTFVARGEGWLSALIVIACVLPQLYWQYKIQHHTEGLWFLMGWMVLISTLMDSVLVYGGIIVYAANPFSPYATPPWMVTIWVSFAVILYATLQKLFDHLVILGLLSWVGFAFSFAMGAKMGAAYFPYGYKTCFLIGSIWMLLLPMMVYGFKIRQKSGFE